MYIIIIIIIDGGDAETLQRGYLHAVLRAASGSLFCRNSGIWLIIVIVTQYSFNNRSAIMC